MGRNSLLNGLDFSRVPTPSFVVDESALEENGRILERVRLEAGCKILLALKGFAMFSMFPILRKYLDGICASSPHEARLGREEFQKEVHVFAPAYKDEDMDELITLSDHIVFNSFTQWEKHRKKIPSSISCGLRINPGYSEAEPLIYNPCAPYSRLGIPLEIFEKENLEGISGLHFHTHCEQNSDALERTLKVVEEKFGKYIRGMKWINFGGGHHITREDYDIQKLIDLVRDFKSRYGVDVLLEPGEAVGLHTGVLVASVMDIIHNGMPIAILDTSAATHMPDVLEMPYRPKITGGGLPGEYAHTYRLGGMTCLAGDVIGDYSFKDPLKPGDKLIFGDMAHYSMVKTNTFNGIQLPSIASYNPDSSRFKIHRTFGYMDFKTRLS